MEKSLTASIDPINDSIHNLMAVVFPKSRSAGYPLSVSIAQGAFRYAETEIDKQLIHMALFSITKEDVNKAIVLLNYLEGIRGLSVFVRGRICQSPYQAIEILRCFSNAITCNDYKAYCHVVMDDPFIENSFRHYSIGIIIGSNKPSKPKVIQRYLFPCRHLHSYFRFQKDHPSSPSDQIQAAAIDKRCDWCPNFHPADFKKLPMKVIYPDGTTMTEPA